MVTDKFERTNIQDLFTFDWVSSPATWTTSAGSGSAMITTCSELLVGGYDKLGKNDWAQHTYTDLTPHYAAIVSMRLFLIDSWDNEFIFIYADDKEVYRAMNFYNASPKHLCGSGDWHDVVFDRATHIFPHFASTMTLYMNSTLSSPPDDESFGFKSVQITLFPCHSTCKTCVGPANTDCTSCSGTLFLNPVLNTCTTTCPTTYYKDNTTNLCTRCYQHITGTSQLQSCKTCDGPNSNNCLTCNTGVYYDPVNKQCVYSCPAQTWADSSTYTCKACYVPADPSTPPFACASCSGTTSNKCLSCFSGAFLDPTTSTCVSTCPNGYYPSTADNKCHVCYTKNPPANNDESCLTCNGPNSNQCLTCASPLLLHNGTQKCVNSCPIGWYADATNTKCLRCYQATTSSSSTQSCYTCSTSNASTSCLSCFPGAYLTSVNTCVLNCPAGTYIDAATNSCKQCYQYDSAVSSDQTCATCTGGNSNNCLSCNPSYYLDPITRKCGTTCPDGYWKDTINEVCELCYVVTATSSTQSCKTCNGSATVCSTCYPGVYFHSVDQTCLLTCPAGWYAEPATYTCNQCYQETASSLEKTCQTCNGSSSNNCLSCASSYLYQGTCLATCPPGSYPETSSMTCQPCFQGSPATDPENSCETCYGPNSNNCLSCSDAFIFAPDNSTCVQKCPLVGYYFDIEDNACNGCYKPSATNGSYQECRTCNGSAATNCQSCYPGTYLYPPDGTCISECPMTYYPDTYTWECISCAYPTQDSSGNLSNCMNGSTGAEAARAVLQASAGTNAALPPLLGGVSSVATLLVNFISELNLFIYINVGFPANFVLFIEQVQVSELIPNPFAWMIKDTDEITNSTIGKFEYWGTETVMLENNGMNICKNLGVLIFGAILSILALVLSGKPNLSRKIANLRNLFLWNLFFSFYLGDFGELFLSSLIQIRENTATGSYATLSLVLSYSVVISYFLIILIGIYFLNRKVEPFGPKIAKIAASSPQARAKRASMPKAKETNIWLSVPPTMRILTEDFKESNPMTRGFLIILTLQTMLVSFIIFFMQDLGLLQAATYTAIAVFFLGHVAYYKPFKSRIQTSILIFNQLIKIVMGIMAIILGIDDFCLKLPKESRTSIGSGLIILIIIGVAANALVGIVLVFSEIWQMVARCIRARRGRKGKSINYDVSNKKESAKNNSESDHQLESSLRRNNFMLEESFENNAEQSSSLQQPTPSHRRHPLSTTNRKKRQVMVIPREMKNKNIFSLEFNYPGFGVAGTPKDHRVKNDSHRKN